MLPALPGLASLAVAVETCDSQGELLAAEMGMLLCGRSLTRVELYFRRSYCSVRQLMPALFAMASMPLTLSLGWPTYCQMLLDDRCLQAFAARPSDETAVKDLQVELAEDVTVEGTRALGRLHALRRLTLTYTSLSTSAVHPWAVAQLESLTLRSSTSSGAEVITALVAASVPPLSSIIIITYVPLPCWGEPSLAALPLSRFEMLWYSPPPAAGSSDAIIYSSDPPWRTMREWVQPLWGGKVAAFAVYSKLTTSNPSFPAHGAEGTWC